MPQMASVHFHGIKTFVNTPNGGPGNDKNQVWGATRNYVDKGQQGEYV